MRRWILRWNVSGEVVVAANMYNLHAQEPFRECLEKTEGLRVLWTLSQIVFGMRTHLGRRDASRADLRMLPVRAGRRMDAGLLLYLSAQEMRKTKIPYFKSSRRSLALDG